MGCERSAGRRRAAYCFADRYKIVPNASAGVAIGRRAAFFFAANYKIVFSPPVGNAAREKPSARAALIFVALLQMSPHQGMGSDPGRYNRSAGGYPISPTYCRGAFLDGIQYRRVCSMYVSWRGFRARIYGVAH